MFASYILDHYCPANVLDLAGKSFYRQELSANLTCRDLNADRL